MRPNVLLIVLDAVRKDHLSCYSHDRPTSPTLSEMTNEASLFTQAVAPAPWTAPSHASLFTGQYPSHHGVFAIQPELSPEQPVLAEILSKAGYQTFGFSNSYYTGVESGLDRGFDYFHDLLELPRFGGRMYEMSIPYMKFFGQYFLRDYDASYFQVEKLKRKLSRSNEPFFSFINLNSAHSPYDPPKSYRNRFESEFDQWDDVDMDAVLDVSARGGVVTNHGGYEYMMGELPMGQTEWDLIKRWYDGEIAYMDDLLNGLFGFLRQEDIYDETLIIITSDHGEHFGEDGYAYHQFSLSEILINVPLIIKWPNKTTSEVSDELISLIDLAPTILDLADCPIPEAMQGRSLLSAEEPTAVFAEYGRPYPPLRERMSKYGDAFDKFDKGLQAARTKERKLIRATTGEQTFYRIEGGMKVDQTEIEVDDEANRLESLIKAKLRSHPEEEIQRDIDEHVKEHLQKMGYM